MRSASHTRTGLTLLAAGAVPFALAPAVHASAALDVPCPFLAATGVPCPLCGGTRAVALAAQGDGAFLEYGAAWVVILLCVAAVGLAALAGRTIPFRRPVAVVAGTLAVAWSWSLANASAITG